MRVAFRIGLLSGSKLSPLSLSASDEGNSDTRWLDGSFDLKTVIAVVGLVLTLVAMRVDTSSKLATHDTKIEQLRGDVDRLQDERAHELLQMQRQMYEAVLSKK